MASYNKILLIGNLTRDVELSYLPSQMPVAAFGLAVNKKYTTAEGVKKERVCFVDCNAFSKTAETLVKYLSKGDPLFIEGELVLDTWTAQDGTKRSKHKVTVQGFQFLGGKKEEPQAKPDDGAF